MRKVYLLVVSAIFFFSETSAQLFQQDFSSSTTVSTYVSATPNNGQFNGISTSGAGVVTSINTTGSNKLRFARAGANSGIYVRTTDFSPVPSSMIYRFDLTVSGNTAAQTTAAVWQIGSGFTTANSTESNAATHSRIGLNWTTTGGQFSLRDIVGGTNSANYTGTQTITWVVNNSGTTMAYKAPNGTYEYVANDAADIWVGTTREFNDIGATTTTQTLADIKFTLNQGTGTVDLDNILIDPIPAKPDANAASNITASGFRANWTPITGVTGYRIDVATDNIFSSPVAGYNDLYVAGQATAFVDVSGLSASTQYYYRVRGASQYAIGEFAGDNSDTISATTSAGGTPDIGLSSPNPAIPAGNIVPGTGANAIYRFDLTVAAFPATLTGVTVNTTGTYTAADVTGYRLYYSTDATLGVPDVLVATLPASGPGLKNFTGFSQALPIGIAYMFVAVDLTCPAVVGNTIAVDAITTADINFTSANESGSAFAGASQTVIAVPPNNVTGAGATNGNNQSVVSWTNPIACYDEILVVAATASNTGTPTGDGTAYTANAAFGAGTALGNGFVVYKGTGTTETVTALTNGTTYYFKIFGRFGTMWNSGVEVTATPAAVSSATDYFRSADPSGGNWGTAASWQSSPDNVTWITSTLVPTSAANTITVRNGHTITVAAAAGGDQIVVEAGGTLSLGANFTLANGTGTDLSVNGTVIQTGGTHTLTGTIAFNSGSLYQHARNGGAILNAADGWAASSTAEITGITSTAPTGQGQLFGNFTWNNTGQSNFFNFNTGNFDTQGLFWVRSTGTSNIALIGDATDRTYDFGSLQVDAGILNLSFRSTSPVGIATVNVTGNVTVNGGTVDFGANVGDPTSGFYRSILNVGGNLSVASGAIFRCSNTDNWGRVRFVAAGTQTVNINSGANVSRLDYHIATGSTTQMLSNLNVNFVAAGDFDEIVIDGVLDAGATAQITGGGDVDINGTLRSAHANGIGATGTLANTGTNTLGAASTIEFSAAGPQVFNNRTDYANVLISGGGAKTLNGPATVNANLNLSNGVVVSSTTNLLTLPAGATFTGGSNSSYVDGPVNRGTNTAAAYTFPVGKGGSYRPVLVTPATTAASVYQAEYFNAAYSDLTICNPARLDAVANNEYWNVSKISGSDAQVGLNYNAANTWSNATAPDGTKAIVVAHFATTCWQDESGTFVLGTSGPAVVTSKVLSTFSPFTLAYGPLAVLPVSFVNVRASQQSSGVKVEWTNLTEHNVSHYSVERSINGSNFVAVGTVNATQNNSGRADYSFVDVTATDAIVYYYRVQAKELNGGAKYSMIVRVNTKSGDVQVNIYPNPATGSEISMQATSLPKGQYTIRVINAAGQQVFTKQLLHNGGSVTQMVGLPASVKTGMYSLQLIGDDFNITRPFVIR